MGSIGGRRREGVLVTLGETMAVLTPNSAESIVDADAFRVDAGGAESNVAGHVVHCGRGARWYSRLGSDALGSRVYRILEQRGIDVSGVRWDDNAPTGLYVKEPGGSVRYYRAGSAASHLSPEDAGSIVLDDAAVVHLTGITPALSTSAATAVETVWERALQRGIPVSFDVNHRPGLWTAQRAAPALRSLANRADIVFVGLDEAARLWRTTTPGEVRSLLPSPAVVVVKDGAVGATVFDGGEECFVPTPPVDVVEEVGAGDAFAGAFLASLMQGDDLRLSAAAGHAQAALALRSTSDFLEETR
jgi:2-dehydro-3-deoxygluconokinase